MIKKLLGLILFIVGIAVIVAVMLRRNNFRSMTSWSGLELRRSIDKPLDQAPAPATEPALAPAASVDFPAADSLATLPVEPDSLTAAQTPEAPETPEAPIP